MAIASIRYASEAFTAASALAGDDLNDAHSLAVHALGPGASVLDIGCGSGEVARRLAQRGCRVLGVEIDPRAAEAAEGHCDRVVVADAEALDWEAAFPSVRFDAVLFLDVLEHLREPGRLLRQVQRLLTAEGRVIASIPNVAHGAVRLQLLDGRFRYAKSGLLDRGHLRFFDADAVERLFADSGYQISLRARIERELGDTEIPVDLEAVPTELLRSLEADPDALTYQFFVVATPHPADARLLVTPEQALVDAHRSRIRELVRLVREGERYRKKLEGELGRKDEHIGRLEDAVRRREDDTAYARKIEEELARKEAHITQLEETLSQHEDAAAYTRKVEGELTHKGEHLEEVERELQGRIAELEAANEERLCLERELLVRNDYLGELQSELVRAESRLGAVEAEARGLEAARQEADAVSGGLLQAAEERAAWLEDVVQQPRHFLTDRANSWMKRRVPTFHRLLRPSVLLMWRWSKD